MSERFTTGYQEWIEAKEPSNSDLQLQRLRSRFYRRRPLISVITPVYNVEPDLLRLAVDSVKAQTYHRWELCLADDASTDPSLRTLLERLNREDPRIKVRFLEHNSGIAHASNEAVQLSRGELLAFLDNDDELAREALFRVVQKLNTDPQIDLIYSDEDKLEEGTGQRVEPFFKPGWSPELLTQMNYVSHLTVISRDLFDRVGGLRPGFEGSQDHDLVLRASQEARAIGHIPKVLYHWRKVPGSAAMASDAKDYAHESGRKAVTDHVGRMGINAEVEILTPGRYRLRYLDEPPTFSTITLAHPSAEAANSAASHPDGDLLLFVSNISSPPSAESLKAMACYAMRPEIAIVGGVIVNSEGVIVEAGLVVGADGSVTRAMAGQQRDRPYYFNLSTVVRECTAASLGLLMIRRELFNKLGGFDGSLPSPYAEADLGLQAIDAGYRNICFPGAVGVSHLDDLAIDASAGATISRRWSGVLSSGDPYFPPGIDPDFSQFRFRV